MTDWFVALAAHPAAQSGYVPDHYAYSREARQHGVPPGMLLRQAALLYPPSHFLPDDPPGYRRAAALLAGFTPRLAQEIGRRLRAQTWVLPINVRKYTLRNAPPETKQRINRSVDAVAPSRLTA